jgi:hypothetical protein
VRGQRLRRLCASASGICAGPGVERHSFAARYSVDIDNGDIKAKAHAIAAAIGAPWLTVQSGGIEDTQPKLHLYYRLAADAYHSVRSIPVAKMTRTRYTAALTPSTLARISQVLARLTGFFLRCCHFKILSWEMEISI